MANPEPKLEQPRLPSADLVMYRFDNTDKKVDDLSKKVDNMTSLFVTKEELAVVVKRLDNYTWYWRTIFTTTLLLIAGVIAALIERR